MDDNMRGIVYSPGFGAGLSTWGETAMAADQTLAHMIAEEEDWEVVEAYCESVYPDAYLGGLRDCVVEWVPVGTQFCIDEHDGSERVVLREDDSLWTTVL